MVYYSYDELNRLKAIKRNEDTVAYFVYDALGRRSRVERGASGACSYYTYDAASRLTNLTHRKSAGVVIASFDYAYDAMVKPIRMTLANGDTCYYTYDKVYQLKSEVRLDSQDQEVYTQYFTYDKAGNRTALSVSGTLGSGTTYYDYNDADELLCERAPETTAYYTYDGNGNTVTKDDGAGVAYYSYDAENRFVAYQKGADTVYYTYDPAGRRVKREAGDTVEKWVFDDLDAIAQYDGEDALQWQHVLAGLDQILRRYAYPYAYDYLSDHLGSTRAIIDTDQLVVFSTYDYSAFGLSHGTPTEGISNTFRFTGREWDSRLGLYYFRARMMAPTLGRFLVRDVTRRHHSYPFVRNLPTTLLDPSGATLVRRGAGGFGLSYYVVFPSERWVKDTRYWVGRAGEDVELARSLAYDERTRRMDVALRAAAEWLARWDIRVRNVVKGANEPIGSGETEQVPLTVNPVILWTAYFTALVDAQVAQQVWLPMIARPVSYDHNWVRTRHQFRLIMSHLAPIADFVPVVATGQVWSRGEPAVAVYYTSLGIAVGETVGGTDPSTLVHEILHACGCEHSACGIMVDDPSLRSGPSASPSLLDCDCARYLKKTQGIVINLNDRTKFCVP